MLADDPLHGAGFTDREMGLIFERAVRSESQRELDRRFTLEELQEIGARVGIDAGAIRTAASSVRDRSFAHRILGAPTRFHRSCVVKHHLGRDKLGDVIAAVRATTGLYGDLRWVPVGVEWRARPALGAIILQFTARRGATRVDVLVTREDAAALFAIFGCAIGAIVGLVAAGLVGIKLAAGPAAALSAMGVGGIGAAFASARLLWGHAARRAAAITDSILETVSTAAERDLADMPE